MSNLEEQLTHAVGAHGMWKARLRDAIATGSSEFDVTTVARDDRCAFGEWLHGGIEPAAKLSPHYAKVKQLHAEFHRAAAGVLDLALSGRGEEAEAQLAMSGEFAHLSAALTREMGAWKQDAAAGT